jgi:hypothetical protein
MAKLPWFMEDHALERLSKRGCPSALRSYAEQFLRAGYTIFPDSIAPALCDALVARFRELEAAHQDKLASFKSPHGHYPRLVNFHLAVPELFELFSSNREALALQDFLFDAETCLYTSLFYEQGSSQALHRDTPYFCTRPEYSYFGMWVALEDVDEENGPLMVQEGGHLLPELDRPAIARAVIGNGPLPSDSQELWDAYQAQVVAQGEARALKVKTLPVRKGSTILWHPQLPHGGAPIRDQSRTRFSLVMHTTPKGTPVYHQQAFFAPDTYFSERAPWSYLTRDGRKFAHHPTVSIGHQKDYTPREFALLEHAGLR